MRVLSIPGRTLDAAVGKPDKGRSGSGPMTRTPFGPMRVALPTIAGPLLKLFVHGCLEFPRDLPNVRQHWTFGKEDSLHVEQLPAVGVSPR